MFHMQERQLLLYSLFKKPIHNAFSHFSCCFYYDFLLEACMSVHQFVIGISVFWFQDDNLSKYQWMFTKLGKCNDIVEVSFGIANGQILSIFDIGICPSHDNGGVLSFHMFIFLYFQVLILLNTQKYFVFLGAVLPRPVS